SAAVALLDRLINLGSLRTTALGYLTGAVPRRRLPQEVRVATTERKTYARPAPVVPRATVPSVSPASSPVTSGRTVADAPGTSAPTRAVATPLPAPARNGETPTEPQPTLSVSPLFVESVRTKEAVAPAAPSPSEA